jgi:hypothetical protein
VETVDLFDVGIVEHARIDHGLGPAQYLLGGLEQEHGGAG